MCNLPWHPCPDILMRPIDNGVVGPHVSNRKHEKKHMEVVSDTYVRMSFSRRLTIQPFCSACVHHFILWCRLHLPSFLPSFFNLTVLPCTCPPRLRPAVGTSNISGKSWCNVYKACEHDNYGNSNHPRVSKGSKGDNIVNTTYVQLDSASSITILVKWTTASLACFLFIARNK